MATKKGNTISTKATETKAEPKQVTVSSILNAEAEKKTTAKATTEKKVVATEEKKAEEPKKATEAKKVTETKKTTSTTEVKKAPAKKAEETKTTAKKVEEPKKTTTKKATTAEKKTTKTAAKKTTAKKTTKKESNLYVQFQGMEFDAKQIEEAVKADFKAKNKKRTMNSVSIYVKPEDMKAYYVIDGIIGDVAL